MPSYSVSLNQHLNQIASTLANKNNLDVQTYVNKIVKEHLIKQGGTKND
jgi:hypothetical protein